MESLSYEINERGGVVIYGNGQYDSSSYTDASEKPARNAHRALKYLKSITTTADNLQPQLILVQEYDMIMSVIYDATAELKRMLLRRCNQYPPSREGLYA